MHHMGGGGRILDLGEPGLPKIIRMGLIEPFFSGFAYILIAMEV
jgi:hypothetical protein